MVVINGTYRNFYNFNIMDNFIIYGNVKLFTNGTRFKRFKFICVFSYIYDWWTDFRHQSNIDFTTGLYITGRMG